MSRGTEAKVELLLEVQARGLPPGVTFLLLLALSDHVSPA